MLALRGSISESWREVSSCVLRFMSVVVVVMMMAMI